MNIVRQSLDSALRCQRDVISLRVPTMVIPPFCLTRSKSLRTRGTGTSTSTSAQRTRSTPNRNSGHHLVLQKVWHLPSMSKLKRPISEHPLCQKMAFRILSLSPICNPTVRYSPAFRMFTMHGNRISNTQFWVPGTLSKC